MDENGSGVNAEDYFHMFDIRLHDIANELKILRQVRPLVIFRRVVRGAHNVEIEKAPTLAVDPSMVVAIEERDHFNVTVDSDFSITIVCDVDVHGESAYSRITLSTGDEHDVFGGLSEVCKVLGRNLT